MKILHSHDESLSEIPDSTIRVFMYFAFFRRQKTKNPPAKGGFR